MEYAKQSILLHIASIDRMIQAYGQACYIESIAQLMTAKSEALKALVTLEVAKNA